MASDLKSDLVMRALQRRPHAKLMGNPAVAFALSFTSFMQRRLSLYFLPPFGTINDKAVKDFKTFADAEF